MGWQTASGTAFRIGGAAPATYDAAGYGAVNYTDVGEITNIGQFGKEWAVVRHQALAKRGVDKRKGSYDNGTINPALALDPDDAGQVAMEVALESDDPYPFEVELKDGTKYYFMGLVTSFRPNIGGSDDVITANPAIEVTRDPMIKV